MILLPWDPDLGTLLGRIRSGDINLQPDFQRGEVWGDPKKRRLIDTILREWHVPPVHVVVDPETGLQEVLDGQQRLVAIRDFAFGDLKVDGNCSPHDDEIASLNGKTYSELPEKFRRRFDTYALRVIRITDFKADEPGELFFRLNQPTSLTAAEQRNAFYGKARAQVKELISEFAKFGVDSDVLGFKNSRMAYDDVVAKVCYSHHVGTLSTKVTAGVVTALFRSGDPFKEEAVSRVRGALELFGKAGQHNNGLKFNKATLFSWLVFISAVCHNNCQLPSTEIADFILSFERGRQQVRDSRFQQQLRLNNDFDKLSHSVQRRLMDIFNDRAASRVADVSSVLTRDLILWLFYEAYSHRSIGPLNIRNSQVSESLRLLVEKLATSEDIAVESATEEYVDSSSWGSVL